MSRRYPIGAEPSDVESGVHVRVWAPTHDKVTLVIEGSDREIALGRDPSGYHAAFAPGVGADARYRFRLGDSTDLVPDPASRFQPEGPFGPSQIVDPRTFAWTDAAWQGIEPHRHVIYELHVGTFTPEGTWAAATEQLEFLAELGVTTLEIMPLHECAGTRNWGYDGVNLFAPSHTYGTPDDFRRFVDRAHARGLGVILDVVYNHFGPSGNSMFAWSPHYRSEHATDWGEALDFDGSNSAGVREFFIVNAAYWIAEFHLDGLRLDATQAIHDRSPDHVLAAITRAARDAGGGRQIFMVGENEPQDASLLVAPVGLDALWNDDFHHAARVAMTGVVDGYLTDYRGTPQEFVSAIDRGFLYQGQLYPWQHNPRGTSTRGLPRRQFVQYLENHDQVANCGFGERLADLADAALLRALTAVLLLSPQLPMLFQGQETGSRRRWHFFVDHTEDLREPVRRGRAEFMAQFARFATPEAQAALSDPSDEATFAACVLDINERSFRNPYVQLHRDLLRLRREEPAILADSLAGATLGSHAFAIRYLHPAGDRLLLVNLGPTFAEAIVPEPLVAPPPDSGWTLMWSSEDPRYGGHGTPPVFTRARLAIPAHAAVVVAPDAASTLHRDLVPKSGPVKQEDDEP